MARDKDEMKFFIESLRGPPAFSSRWYLGEQAADIIEKQADEIERLREENEKLKTGSRIVAEKLSWEAFQKASDEIERLRKEREIISDALRHANDYGMELKHEIERLREALNLIRVAIENYGNGGKSEGFALGYADEDARAALKEDE